MPHLLLLLFLEKSVMPSTNVLHVSGSESKFLLRLLDDYPILREKTKIFIPTIRSESVKAYRDRGVIFCNPVKKENKYLNYLLLPFTIISYVYKFRKLVQESNQIFLHGIFDKKLILWLNLSKTTCIKSTWIIWGGGDLDVSEAYSWSLWNLLKTRAKRRVQSYSTYIEEDYLDLVINYGISGPLKRSLLYPSNILKDIALPDYRDAEGAYRVLVGHSADFEANHVVLLRRLHEMKIRNLKVHVVLSYGEKPWNGDYKELVKVTGQRLFGEGFIVIEEFMKFDAYREFLASMDLIILDHRYQQAMGNIITALGLNVKIALNPEANHFAYLKRLGFTVFNSKLLEETVQDNTLIENRSLALETFSESKLLEGWNQLLA